MSDVELMIVADATPDSGAGHVMRCAAIAESWKRDGFGPARIHGTIAIPFVRRRLAVAGVQPIDSIRRGTHGMLLLDSYENAARETGRTLHAGSRALVDDLGGADAIGYDAVWNPNAYGRPDMYPNFSGAVITGPDAVAIRDVPAWGGQRTNEVVVVLGAGSTAENLRTAMEQLPARCPSLRFKAPGEGFPPGFRRFAADELWTEAVNSGVLVTAAGSSVWEAAACGVPTVVVCTDDNQRRVYEWAVEAGCPGVLAEKRDRADRLVEAMASALGRAKPLPRIANGAARVAHQLKAVHDRRAALTNKDSRA